MFAAAVFAKERLLRHHMLGALIAFGGLCYLLVPTGSVAMDPFAVCLMVLAGIGWGAIRFLVATLAPACL
jgi:drug/metabolite transporter (DMT)-like permease